MKRRELMILLGGAMIAAPALRAQQKAMPVIGYLSAATLVDSADLVAAFRQGLSDAGYVEGQNVLIEYGWAEGHYDRLSGLATDLVRRQVTVIAATSTPVALAAKAATATIPIGFTIGGDPVKFGLVTSLSRPHGNLTGVTRFNVELGPKRLELLHEMVPTAARVALLVNPTNPNTETFSRDLQMAADALGLNVDVLQAGAESEFDALFATLVQWRIGA